MNIVKRLSARRCARNAAALLALALVAATPLDSDLVALREGDRRVADVAWRLQTAGPPLCATTEPLSGLTLQSLSQFAPADRRRVAEQIGMDSDIAVAAVATGSPAASAGLRAGDALVAIDAERLPAGAGKSVDLAPLLKSESLLQAALTASPVELTVARAGVIQRIELSANPGCAARAQFVPGGFQATRADGRTVQISDRMLREAESDDALAAVMAHELAHTILSHAAKRTPSRQAEYEADWLSVWLVARAGYDLDAIVPFWTRLLRKTDAGLFSDGTHPGWRKRIPRLEAAVALAKAQRAAGAPLVPAPQQQTASQPQNPR